MARKPKAAPEAEPTEIIRTIGQDNSGTEHNSRKLFSIPVKYAFQFDGKKGLVVSGYSGTPIDGHYPHVSSHRIIRDLGLNGREYAQCDERHQEIITAATEAGLEIVTVEVYQVKLQELAKQ